MLKKGDISGGRGKSKNLFQCWSSKMSLLIYVYLTYRIYIRCIYFYFIKFFIFIFNCFLSCLVFVWADQTYFFIGHNSTNISNSNKFYCIILMVDEYFP